MRIVRRSRVSAPGRGAAISPLRLQLFEVTLAAVAFYFAVHLGSKVSVVLVAIGVLVGVLALVTRGPIGVVAKVSPRGNVAGLACIGVLAMATPLAVNWARSAEAIVVLEGGAVLIGIAIFGVVRASGSARAVAASAPPTAASPTDRATPSDGLSASLRFAGRLTGRLGGRARAIVADQAPIAARRAGQIIGSRRHRS
jgi:hypothetical protein